MKKEEKRKIRLRILDLQDEHCKGCTKVPKYGISGNHQTSWCSENCQIGRTLKKLGDSLDEGRTNEMGEKKNWDQLCVKAEKLREQDKEQWTWGKIADHLGVSDKTLYYHIAKRRDENQPSVKRVGTTKQKPNIKNHYQSLKLSYKRRMNR